eukprot:CAMPEP_0174958868 /NCGR_PEP_ID=MMETSP0004_2-20121128/2864_1 /TAXON_ID=420556 /ORGANISM="Ochromonas sp., Strain CCMP1393" /LENGTH=130 /DNA_ID=CAMNT_0016207131 /DNA_START=68 /DNA_END=460 /DNA_ORIENTATION=+
MTIFGDIFPSSSTAGSQQCADIEDHSSNTRMKSATDIKRMRLEVIKNALCLAIFLAFGGYALGSTGNPDMENAPTIALFLVTFVGILFFAPRLCIALFKFLDYSEEPTGPHHKPLLNFENEELDQSVTIL